MCIFEFIGIKICLQFLATGSRGQPEERTRGNCVFQKKLVAARRGTARRAGVAWRKGQGRNSVARGAAKGRTNEKRLWKGPECKSGINDRGLRRQLHLKNEKTAGRIFGGDFQTKDRETSSRIFCRVMKNQELDIVEGSAPSKME
jgi:hypothetical protein